MKSRFSFKASVIGVALAGGVAFSTVASAGETVIEQNIAAIFAPDSRPAASAGGQRTGAVSILDGIAETWRDPSRSTATDAADGSATVAATRTSGKAAGTNPVQSSRTSSVQESLRGVFSAYSAN